MLLLCLNLLEPSFGIASLQTSRLVHTFLYVAVQLHSSDNVEGLSVYPVLVLE